MVYPFCCRVAEIEVLVYPSLCKDKGIWVAPGVVCHGKEAGVGRVNPGSYIYGSGGVLFA